MSPLEKRIGISLLVCCCGCISPAAQARVGLQPQANPAGQSVDIGEKAQEISTQRPAAALALARSLRQHGKYPEAILYYRRYLQSRPGSERALFELGETLRLARRFRESVQVFRRLVRLNANNLDAEVGLGEALAAAGRYGQALACFNQVLKKRPDYYDALQGKAYVLFWQGKLAAARSAFETLRKRDPHDLQNSQALREIRRAQQAAHWKAMRPAAGASPQSWIIFYRKRLASFPKDREAMKGLAYKDAQLGRDDAAIQDFRRVLQVYPHDRDSELELARLLSHDRHYAAAIGFYRRALQQDPGDVNVLSDLARVYVWSGHQRQALKIDQRLLRLDPSNRDYLLAAGKIEMQLKRYHAARQTLYALLEAAPENKSAELDVARIDADQRRYRAAAQNYNILLKRNPQDPAALLGKARIDFYQGKLREAEAAATEEIQKRPNDFSALFLLASIEHARHHRRKALNLLSRAEKLSPGNDEVALLRDQTLKESRVTLRTTVAFAREIGPPTEFKGHTGLANEDLRTYTYGTTIGFNFLPRTKSYFSFASLPTDSPPGPDRDKLGNQIPTGITGATAPYEFLYRQSTRFSRRLTVRAGAGSVRFGPGDQVSIPGQILPVEAAKESPIGLAGVSFRLADNLCIDVDATQAAITYTPVSTRLGVIRDRIQGRINYFFNSRTQLHWAYWYEYDSSEDYTHTADVNGIIESTIRADHDRVQGELITFDRNVLRSERLSLDAGYEGRLYGVIGQGRDVYLGFFNPGFYQSHEIVPRIYGPLWGPVAYDVSAGIGIQQVGHGEAITRAWNVSPSFSVRVSRHLRLILGYVHYNTAQILGPLRGNEVRFSTEWQY